MDADGKNQQRLTENPRVDFSPSWSPDGKRIVFSSVGARDSEIYVMDADGGNQQKLTENRQHDRIPHGLLMVSTLLLILLGMGTRTSM